VDVVDVVDVTCCGECRTNRGHLNNEKSLPPKSPLLSFSWALRPPWLVISRFMLTITRH